MAKKKKKKFQKKQFISLFENRNYQKLISKAKQFEIEGIDENELNTVLITSYQNLAQSNFEKGDIARAIRDIDSLLQIDNDTQYKLIKLKYLCYIEHFEDAIELGGELILVKNKKIQKEALFLYLMAKLYSGDYELDNKQLKAIPISRQRYILGFKSLLEEDKALALDYFNKCNPRAKLEKENIKAIIGILSEEKALYKLSIKPLYRFLLTGEANGVANSKNFREIKKEVKEKFDKVEKNADIKGLLALKKSVPIDVISKNAENKEQKSRLIYNNIVLLADRQKYNEALKLFIKHKDSLVKFIESASLLMEIKNQTEDKRSDSIAINFLSSYLRVHYKKIAPHQIDYILLFILQKDDVQRSMDLAERYGRDNFVFFLKELPLMREFNPYYQTRFNTALKKHSAFTDILLHLMIHSIGSVDEDIFDFTQIEEETFLNRLYILIILLQNLDKPNRKYRDNLFKLLKALALVIQSFSYDEQESIYLKLSIVIEQYIDYFKIDRFNLAIDIKALFVSISKKESVKKDNIYDDEDEDDYFYIARKILFEDDYEEDKYNFDIAEYDLSMVKQKCLVALDRGDSEPFKSLEGLNDFRYYKFKIPVLLELLAKVVELKLDINRAINQMLLYLNIDLYSSPERDSLMAYINEYALKNINIAIMLIEYALSSTNSQGREFVWYLKWIDGYLSLIDKYGLEKNRLFRTYRDFFLKTQEKKKFKSLNAKYKKIKKLDDRQGALL